MIGRKVNIRFRQILSHGSKLVGLDLAGNVWITEPTSPTGWRKMGVPMIELAAPEPVTQIGAEFPRTVHFNNDKPKERWRQ